MNSLNARFTSLIPDDHEFDHPKGAWLARRLAERISEQEWKTEDIDNWRDCGWSISCFLDDSKLQVVISQIEEHVYMFQIAPLDTPGLIGSLLGKKASANESDIYTLAQACSHIFKEEIKTDSIWWCWDGFPDEANSTNEPEQANQSE